jgi:16S rRNA (cytosine967-C5)-methyltransferase
LSAEPKERGAALRAAAARVDTRVCRDGASLETALAHAEGVAERDRALLRALVSTALRWHHRLDWQIAQLVTRKLKPADAALAALLRIGLAQLQWLRVPDHAAVSATVAAATALGLGHARGFVNAVLRRFVRERASLEERMQAIEEARFSHPQWLIDRLKHDWPARWTDILEANNSEPPMWLRVNRRRIGRAGYLELLGSAGIAAEPSTLASDAVLLAEPRPAESLPGFAEGLVSIQDLAAQRARELLDLTAGARVLDACAAPGGKTAHMLEFCHELAEVVALDRDAARLETVAANLSRLGLAATLITADATDLGAWWDGRAFDRILLDAPCSALGVIRRHPDIKVLRRPTDVGAAAERQATLLGRLWPTLAPGGRLVYATCTLLDEENDAQIDAFVRDTADAERLLIAGAPSLKLVPGEANADGFYYASVGKRSLKVTHL